MIRNRPPSTKQLALIGLLIFAAGFAFQALDRFANGYIRDDAFILGSLAMGTSFVLWLADRLQVPVVGRIAIRLLFVATVGFWMYVSIAVLRSDLSLVIGVPFALSLAALLYPVWLVTWFPTKHSEPPTEFSQSDRGRTQSVPGAE